MINYKAFTLKSNSGLLRSLKTKCGVCIAFDPLITKERPNISTFECLWDTGASGTVISKTVVEKLDLKPIGKSKVFHANGESIVNVYAINLFLPNQVAFNFVKVTEGVLNGFDLLIGMDIITSGDFSITNVDGLTSFSFRVPSIRQVDFVSEKMSVNTPIQVEQPKLGRNSLCHCGSGRKYKHCHGK
jgi:predicted aspartyl protease